MMTNKNKKLEPKKNQGDCVMKMELKFEDAQKTFYSFAVMLFSEKERPVWNREFFDDKKMDFSIESLIHLDAYLLDAFDWERNNEIDDDMIIRIIMRTGAYFGEVLSKNSVFTFEWITCSEATERGIEFPEPCTPFDNFAFLHRVGDQMSIFPYSTVRKTFYSREIGKIISLHETAQRIMEIFRSPYKVLDYC